MLVIIFFIIVISCKNINTKSNIISIDVNKESKYNMSDLIKKIHYIKLETNEKSIIGETDKVIIADNKIFVLDNRKAISLFIFDLNGKYLSQINKRGRGPGEFNIPSDFFIDNFHKQILISDPESRRILFYNFNGNFINELKTDFFFNSFYLYKDNLFFDLTNIPYLSKLKTLIITNLEGKLVSSLIPFDKNIKYLSLTTINPFNLVNDTLCFLPTLSNEIFSVSLTNTKEKYLIDFGENWPNLKEIDMSHIRNPAFYVQKLSNSDYVSFLNFIETNNILYLNYYYHKEKRNVVFYKNNKELIICKSLSDNSFAIVKNLIGAYENKFIGVIQIPDIIEQGTEHLNNIILSPDLQKILKVSKESDNPIIALIDF